MSDIFVGITQGISHNCINIGIVNFSNSTVFFKSFLLDRVNLSKTISMFRENIYSSDINEIDRFLSENIPQPDKVQVVVEIPSAFLDGTSIFFKLLSFLTRKKYVEEIEFRIFDKEKIKSFIASSPESWHELTLQLRFKYFRHKTIENKPFFGVIPQELAIQPHDKRGLIYIQSNISQAYAKFLFGDKISNECTAVVAALIGSHRYLYHFLTSYGVVHSSQDIVEFIRHNARNSYSCGSAVVSASEVYCIQPIPLTKLEEINKIPLRYAVEKKKHEFLGDNDAIKFSLLYVCKHWKIRLWCSSLEDEYFSYPSSLCQEENFRCWKEYVIYNQKTELNWSKKEIIYEPQETVVKWISEALKGTN